MDTRELTLSDLLNMMLRKFWIFAAAMVAGALLGYCYASYFITPLYKSQTKYAVVSQNSPLSKFCIEILDTYSYAQYISEKLNDMELDAEYSPKSLYDLVDYDYQDDTGTYTVTVSAYSPHDSAVISKCIEEESETYLIDIMKLNEEVIRRLQVLDRIWDNKSPSNINVMLSAFFGLVIGAIIPFLILLLLEIKDTRIKNEKAITDIFKLPVLGSIPDYSASHKGRRP